MKTDDAAKAYRTFYDRARNNGVLDLKTSLLIHMAGAMARGCYP